MSKPSKNGKGSRLDQPAKSKRGGPGRPKTNLLDRPTQVRLAVQNYRKRKAAKDKAIEAFLINCVIKGMQVAYYELNNTTNPEASNYEAKGILYHYLMGWDALVKEYNLDTQDCKNNIL